MDAESIVIADFVLLLESVTPIQRVVAQQHSSTAIRFFKTYYSMSLRVFFKSFL